MRFGTGEATLCTSTGVPLSAFVSVGKDAAAGTIQSPSPAYATRSGASKSRAPIPSRASVLSSSTGSSGEGSCSARITKGVCVSFTTLAGAETTTLRAPQSSTVTRTRTQTELTDTRALTNSVSPHVTLNTSRNASKANGGAPCVVGTVMDSQCVNPCGIACTVIGDAGSRAVS